MTSILRKGGKFSGETITTLLIGYTPIQSILVLKIKIKKIFTHEKRKSGKFGHRHTQDIDKHRGEMVM